MKPPDRSCGACGEKHWGKCGDRGDKTDSVPTAVRRDVGPARNHRALSKNDRGDDDDSKAKSHRDYMRDLMRLKRAKERIPKLEAELKRLRELLEQSK